ncbi:MAG: lytic transglycosylase domain-containing protein [Pseudomonadota bacterium]
MRKQRGTGSKQFMRVFSSLLVLILTGTIWPLANATVPSAPSLKPELRAVSTIVSTRDAAELRNGMAAVEARDWWTVERAEQAIRDTTARDILTWYRARRDPQMSFDALDRALSRLGGWPESEDIRARAEAKISDSTLDASGQIAWFQNHGGPSSGEGALALALAHDRLGQSEKALAIARKAWHGQTLDDAAKSRLLSTFGNNLTAVDHQQRADFLLWTRQTRAASALKPYLNADWRALVEARIRLIRRARGVDSAVEAVPGYLSTHPGLTFDRAQWRRRARLTDRVAPLLRTIDGNQVPAAGRTRLWSERNLATRAALKQGDFRLAYDLSAPHGLSQGRSFAEAEWMAGWIALRHLGDAETALVHFETLEQGVGTPISLARARYWTGRALEALGRGPEARAAYDSAATYPFTYYGQLAAEKVAQGTITLQADFSVTDADRTQFNQRALVRALRLFAENGYDASFRKIAYHLDDQLSLPQDFELLAELGRSYHYKDIGVRGAKAGLAKGVVAPDAAYPLVDYPLLQEPRVERSLMLALSRQESEMNPAAISHANARGLMQFIPRTAQIEARRQGLPYRKSWLTDDPGYNMTLGGAHLDTLLNQFNGSYIMTAAAYNAGASRPNRWIGDYGDPRAGEVDPIDWVEFIPFSETRNYVQRVLENTQVYRHRLTGAPEPIRLSADLHRGRFANE